MNFVYYSYYVYILVNSHHTVFYTGVTNDLERRCKEHKLKKVKGFTQKYNVDKLVYFEYFDDINLAITREKQLKRYPRKRKVELIEINNCTWTDLYFDGKVQFMSKKLSGRSPVQSNENI